MQQLRDLSPAAVGAQEEALRIRQGESPKHIEEPSPTAPVEQMKSLKLLKLSSQRSFDITASGGLPAKTGSAHISSASLASHILTFDEDDLD